MKKRRILCLIMLLIGGVSHWGYIAELLGTPFFFVGMGCFATALVLFISGGSRAAEPASPQPIPVAEPEPPPPLPTAHREQCLLLAISMTFQCTSIAR